MPTYAFRCKACGHLHEAAHAGAARLPGACNVCRAGVVFSPAGIKRYAPENWEVLADATPERLDELGLSAADVERHAPDHDRVAAENLQRCQEALATLAEKKQRWQSQPVAAWQEQLDALHARLDAVNAAIAPEEPGELATVEHERNTLRQQIHDLLACEWTERDDAHQAELEAALAAQGRPRGSRKVQHHVRRTNDMPRSFHAGVKAQV